MVDENTFLNLKYYLHYYILMLGLIHNFEPEVEYEVYGSHVYTSRIYKTFKKITGFKYLWKGLPVLTFEEFISENFDRRGMENYPYRSRLHEWKVKFPINE